MKPTETKLLFYTQDTARVYAFYSALGICWLGDVSGKMGAVGPPSTESGDEHMGLPRFWGQLGSVEIMVYLDVSLRARMISETTMVVSYESEECISKIVAILKSLGLFTPAPKFREHDDRLILDPDGRQIALVGPNPYGF